MSKKVKILIGVLSISPFIVFAAMIYGFISTISRHSHDLPQFFFDHELSIYLLNITFTIYFAAIHIFFIYMVARNKRLGSMYSTWILLTVLFGAFVFPFYWYHYIWNEGFGTTRSTPLGLNS